MGRSCYDVEQEGLLGMDGTQYDIAQFCENGHVVTLRLRTEPRRGQKFCEQCGAATLHACPKCGTTFRGPALQGRGFIDTSPPAFCRECGTSLPWTASAMQAAIELIAEDANLSAEERKAFADNLPDAARDTPKASVAAQRLGLIIKNSAPAVGRAVKDLLVNVLSDAMIKAIWHTC